MPKKKANSRRGWPHPLASRNKWAVRGRAIGYFFSSLIFAIVSSLFHLLYGLLFFIGSQLAALWQASRTKASGQKPEPETIKNDFDRPFSPVAGQPDITFDDIVGLEEAKDQIQQRLVMPFRHPKEAKALGIIKGGGLLLVGPPGTGKTSLARAVAGGIDAAFFHVLPADIIRPGVGQSEARINELFATLRQYPKAVLFLDEVEAILTSRSKTSSTIMKRVVPQMLAQWQGIMQPGNDSVLLVLGASNEPWDIDYAARRPGRFDAIVFVDLPDLDARRLILKKLMADLPLSPLVEIDDLAAKTGGLTGSDLQGLVSRTSQIAFKRTVEKPEDESAGLIVLADLELALSRTALSVTPEDVGRFRKFCEKFSRERADR